MPGSSISLDSLSSPSPSPSPPPDTNKPAEITNAGLDSDSELSELTEEEQEAEKQDEDEDENNDESTDHANRRGLRPSRRGGRRKRSSIVPAPMWGWAETKTSNVVEEEEEEEMAGPPRAMEEEEDEEEEDESVGPSFSSGGPRKNLIDDEGDDDRPEDEGPEHTPAIDPADEEESFSGDDGPPSRSRRVRRSARVSRPQDDLDSNSSEDEVDDLQKCEEEQDEDEDEDDDISDAPPDQPDVESENETESEDEDSKEQDIVDLKTPAITTATASKQLKAISTATLMDMDIDVTAPSPQAVAPFAAAAAASSIMAGSTVLNAPSPSPSSSSSASGSPNSSRSPSPVPHAPIKSSELAEANGVARPKREPKQKQNVIDKDTKIPLAPAKDIHTALNMDIDIPEHDRDRDRSAEDIDIDEPSPDDDLEIELESDLQPAHRAEALDVLATIELKFALLRERVYVEKMECLAWEEALVGEGNHPELLHLHRELSKRRDKRIELATRKRAYEVANVTKRRRVDEDATWSWWKLARDDLQTDMISEANRTRRRLERERRAVERPQPVRRIPNPPRETPVPPTLRKIIKSFPFGNRRQNKRDNFHVISIPLLYPELSTLSSSDINSDLEFLYQHRRTSYDAHRVGSVNMNPPFGPQVPQPHGYDPYNDGIGIPPSFGMQPPPPPVFQHLAPAPLQQAGGGKSIPGFPPYGTSGPGSGRIQLQPTQAPPPSLHNHTHHHGLSQFVLDQGSGAGPILPPHPYFGSQSGASGSGYGGNTGRRSISPVNLMPNGSGAKHNGTWMGAGMGMGTFHGSSKTNEWMSEGRRGEISMNEDEDRERTRERDRREKERDREHQELERERQRENYHMQQQQQHRHPPPPQHQHVHNVSPGQVPHHHGVAPHHHHRPHHHHVLHHHHGQPGAAVGHASSSLPPGAGPSLSPRASREFDSGRPHSGPAQHPTEIINLSSSKPPIPSHWKGDDPQGSSSSDYRDVRNKHGGRPPSGPPLDDRERPLAIPFVMTSTHAMQPSNISPPASAPPNGTSSPRGSWNTPEDNSFRIPPPSSGYLGSHEGQSHSPGHRYTNSSSSLLGRGPPPPQPSRQNSLGLSPPRPRPLPPPSPSSSSNAYPNPVRSPARFGPPRSRSPPINLKMHRPSSPAALSTKMMSGPPAPSSSMYSPRLSGPGRTSTPTGLAPSADIQSSAAPSTTATAYSVGNRTASPVMPFPSPSSHPSVPLPLSSRPSLNSNGTDRDRDRHMSPRLPVLPPPKMAVPQMVDGH